MIKSWHLSLTLSSSSLQFLETFSVRIFGVQVIYLDKLSVELLLADGTCDYMWVLLYVHNIHIQMEICNVK